MKIFAQCICGDCRIRFIVIPKKYKPGWKLICPACESKLVEEKWKKGDYKI